MELYKNTEEAFVNYLKRHGYPDESISLEWGTTQCAIDIAVLASDLITPVAVYEIKGRKTPEIIRKGIDQLKRAVKFFDITVSCNLVFGSDNATGFEVIDVTKNVYNDEPINISEIMESHPLKKPISYGIMQAGATSKAISKRIKNKQEKIDRIKWLCWLLFPLLAIVLLLLDAFGKYQITALRLAVIGATVVIILIPFFSEITLKDVTFKRKSGN
ncbi:MAG: hypothetical protein J5449_03140 [Oscillospiraceae bacterium]|nr:hypothetical protein [Oscillospiraceae bacterium]